MLKTDHIKLLKEAYPQLSEDELMEAEENFRRYVGVIKTIYDELRLEKPKVLTRIRNRARLRKGAVKKALR